MTRRTLTSWTVFWIGTLAALGWGWFTHVSVEEQVDGSESPPASEQGANPDVTAIESTETTEAPMTRREVVMMGSSFVFVVDSDPELAVRAIQAASNRLRQLESEVSSWRPDSDISRLNARAGIGSVRLGDDTFELLQLARELHHLTNGTFDVTIGPVWNLWPFRDPTRPIPSDEELAEAGALVDASRIELNEADRTAFLPNPGMEVNLGAVGKGYAARLAIDTMRELGVKRAVVSAGGDLYLLGRKTTGPWVVGLEHPRWTGRVTERFVVGDIAVATSGNSQRYVVRNNRSYGHILDPRTGKPVEECLSVTVLTADPARADAYATAVFVMGPQNGLDWVEKQANVEALIVDRNGHQHRSNGWSEIAGSPPDATQSLVPAVSIGNQVTFRTRTTPLAAVQLPARPVESGSGEMVLVPDGEFLSGDDKTRSLLPAFRIDRTEVTNGQYEHFLNATESDPHEFCHPDEPHGKDHTPRYWREFRPPLFRSSSAAELAPFDAGTFRKPDHPVVGVDWWDAWAFARWAGKRLPTRLEREKAARGLDGRVWPWGDQWDHTLVNAGGEKWAEHDGHIYTAPAHSFEQGVSTYGCLHMAGNVAEWTEEGFVAGGSSNCNLTQVRCTAGRLREPEYRSFDIGFRCVRSEGDTE